MEEKILIVDDEEMLLASFRRQLRSKFNLYLADSANSGLNILEKSGPFAVVISDYRMPKMDGNEFLHLVSEKHPDTTRIMLTGNADISMAIESINKGNIFRFLTKPCAYDMLISNIQAAIRQYNLVKAEKILLEKTFTGGIRMLIDILSMVAPVVFKNTCRIRDLSKKVAIRLRVKNISEVEISALLSQIGCVTVPPDILERKFSAQQLTKEESELFYNHPKVGQSLLSHIPRLENIALNISKQFEDIPEDSRKKEEIPIASRIIRTVTDYVLLENNGKASDEAIDILEHSEQNYDKDILIALRNEAKGIDKEYVLTELPFKELKPGMILAQDIRNNENTLLLAKDTTLTSVAIMRLINLIKVDRIAEPVKILVKE